MKKFAIALVSLFVFAFSSYAQDGSQTAKGSWLVEANTGFGGGDTGFAHTANTGFGLTSFGDTTIWSIGGEAGYFIEDNLAIKAGLGYSDFDITSAFSYKLGAKYYVINIIPIQVDVTGASFKDVDENPLWLGLQGGYAIFVSDQISIEPGLRYNLSLNKDFTDEGIFEFRIGFALHF
jgi:opacity protein-like surface antigen